MTNTPSWAFQYFLAALLALFAGPILSKLPGAQSFPLTLFGLNGAHTIRLIVAAAGLALLSVLSLRAFRHMPDNGRGFSFLRTLVLPLTTLLIVIAADKTVRVVGQSLISRLGFAQYTLTYAALLAFIGLWITAAWLLNMDALHRFSRKRQHRPGAKNRQHRSRKPTKFIQKKNASSKRPG